MIGRAVTDEQKAAILARLLEVWRRVPELRLGQLLENFGPRGQNLFYAEDEDLIYLIEKWSER